MLGLFGSLIQQIEEESEACRYNADGNRNPTANSESSGFWSRRPMGEEFSEVKTRRHRSVVVFFFPVAPDKKANAHQENNSSHDNRCPPDPRIHLYPCGLIFTIM
jgi:hypothetical protein